MALLAASAGLQADFSASQVSVRPQFPDGGPFIVDIAGTWPSDCHPGEQRPYIESWDGETLVVEFEIVVVHITCNDVETPFRSLLDMSEAVRESPPDGNSIAVTARFQGATLQQTVEVACPPGLECPEPEEYRVRPERGLFHDPGRAGEGLLIARQGDYTAVYPLVYDEAGNPEWLFSVGRPVGGAYFADLYRFSGGDCLECDATGADPRMAAVGSLTVLFDSPGLLQVQVNERPFKPYAKLVYGYDVFPPLPGGPPLVGLEGRWALSENRGTDPPLGDLTRFLPPAFDIAFQSVVPDPGSGLADGQAYFLVTTLTGEELGQLVCKGEASEDGRRNRCDFIDPTDAAEPLLLFFQDGPSSLSIEYGRAVIELVGTPPGGKAVRLD